MAPGIMELRQGDGPDGHPRELTQTVKVWSGIEDHRRPLFQHVFEKVY